MVCVVGVYNENSSYLIMLWKIFFNEHGSASCNDNIRYFLILTVSLIEMQTHYVLLLCSFKEQLQQHVRVHAMEAVMACWEIEQSLQSLTGDV